MVDDHVNRFNTTLGCDRRTDRQTDKIAISLYQYRALYSRAIELDVGWVHARAGLGWVVKFPLFMGWVGLRLVKLQLERFLSANW